MSTLDSEFDPSSYPQMPGGLSTVELETISLARLECDDTTEQDRLFEICKGRGFFYLDFSNTSAASLPAQSEEVARISEQIFALPLEEKQKYLPDPPRNILFGYKHAGRTLTDKQGTPDTAEFFNVSKDEMLRTNPTLPWPTPVTSNKSLLSNYATTAHQTGLFIMSILARKLGLPSDAFSNLHRLYKTSGDHIRMTRGPPRKDPRLPEIQVPGHTDFGTITILFNWLGGLQVWSESNRGQSGFQNVIDPESDSDSNLDSEESRDGGSGGTSSSSSNNAGFNGGDRKLKPRWLWVTPKPGHAIINLGDAAVKFTNGLFCSGRHRVVPAPGAQGTYPRYSVVYFVRPEDDAVLKTFESDLIPQSEGGSGDGENELMTAKEWIAMQVKGLETKPVRD